MHVLKKETPRCPSLNFDHIMDAAIGGPDTSPVHQLTYQKYLGNKSEKRLHTLHNCAIFTVLE